MSTGTLTGLASDSLPGVRGATWLPEAAREVWARQPMAKRLAIAGGMFIAFAVLVSASYVVRELIAALVVVSIVFAALLLIACAGAILYVVAKGAASGVRALGLCPTTGENKEILNLWRFFSSSRLWQ